MANRYYISRVLGSGTWKDPYYSELRRYVQTNWPNEPHFSQQVIAPTVLLWCVMKYDLSQAAHSDVMANLTGIFSFPETGLDRTVSEIPVEKRNEMQTKLENLGFRFDWATSTTTIRQILKYLNRSIQLAEWAEVSITAVNHFDFDTTVAEIPVNARNKIAAHLTNLGVPIDWITGSTTVLEIANRIQRKNSDGSQRLFGTQNCKQWLYQDEDDF